MRCIRIPPPMAGRLDLRQDTGETHASEVARGACSVTWPKPRGQHPVTGRRWASRRCKQPLIVSQPALQSLVIHGILLASNRRRIRPYPPERATMSPKTAGQTGVAPKQGPRSDAQGRSWKLAPATTLRALCKRFVPQPRPHAASRARPMWTSEAFEAAVRALSAQVARCVTHQAFKPATPP